MGQHHGVPGSREPVSGKDRVGNVEVIVSCLLSDGNANGGRGSAVRMRAGPGASHGQGYPGLSPGLTSRQFAQNLEEKTRPCPEGDGVQLVKRADRR